MDECEAKRPCVSRVASVGSSTPNSFAIALASACNSAALAPTSPLDREVVRARDLSPGGCDQLRVESAHADQCRPGRQVATFAGATFERGSPPFDGRAPSHAPKEWSSRGGGERATPGRSLRPERAVGQIDAETHPQGRPEKSLVALTPARAIRMVRRIALAGCGFAPGHAGVERASDLGCFQSASCTSACSPARSLSAAIAASTPF